MEDSLLAFLIIFTVSTVTLAGVYLAKFSALKRKKAVKSVEDVNADTIRKSYENSMEILKIQNDFLMQDSKTTKKRLAAEIGINLRENQEENEINTKITTANLQEHYEIDINSITKLLPTLNIPLLQNIDMSKIPELINNPIIKSKAWDYIKQHKQEMIDMGVIVPIGKTTELQEENKAPVENSQFVFGENSQKYMA